MNGEIGMEILGKIATILVAGAKTLWGWLTSGWGNVHHQMQAWIAANPGLCATIIEVIFALLIVGGIWVLVWPPKLEPGSKKIKHKAKTHRLVVLAGILVLLYLAACFLSMG